MPRGAREATRPYSLDQLRAVGATPPAINQRTCTKEEAAIARAWHRAQAYDGMLQTLERIKQ